MQDASIWIDKKINIFVKRIRGDSHSCIKQKKKNGDQRKAKQRDSGKMASRSFELEVGDYLF